MTAKTNFLREQTLSGANKCMRAPLPDGWSTADLPYSLPERKALGLKMIMEKMPLFIGEEELIVGTRTFFKPNPGNEDGHDRFEYSLYSGVPYVNQKDIQLFGCDQSWVNKTHYTPDFSILLEKGVGGILASAEERKKDPALTQCQREFLSSVIIAYTGLQTLILRYGDYAAELARKAEGEEKARLSEIASVCRKISAQPPETFRESVQLLWFGHLGTILESFEFINYGRLDVILGKYLGDTPREEAQQLLECLLLKMYDQTDLNTTYLNKYAAQLVVTLGGVLENGENAVNEVSLLFLDAIGNVRLPEPEFNLRINSKNPPEFLERAAKLSISGCNFVSYYNDDLFVESMSKAGLPVEIARQYGFDLCQDINIPGKSDFYVAADISLSHILLDLLNQNMHFSTFDQLFQAYKEKIAANIRESAEKFNQAQEHLMKFREERFDEYFADIREKGLPADWYGRSPMCPLPYLSGLFHGTVENAADMVYESYPIKEKGMMLGTATEALNSLAAIKKVVYDDKRCTLEDVVKACRENYKGEGQEVLRNLLWNAPKWGNDDDYADSIAVDLLEYGLAEIHKYKTFSGGQMLAGIHQPHPVPTGERLAATPEGRFAHTPAAVTLTPESGTMKNGPTAALKSASKLNPELIQWNFCVMVNYFASVFKGNDGVKVFQDLLAGYFKRGGLQHQPNILDVNELKHAQIEPEKYKDLIVRLWGVSAHFVDLPRELQDEMIARFSY